MAQKFFTDNSLSMLVNKIKSYVDNVVNIIATGKADKEHGHTIIANASDDDVIILAGTNGTNQVTYSATHANSGVTAGTYKSVTVNAKGHITGGSNPTTLAGYGITNAYTKTEMDSALSNKANKSHDHDNEYDQKGSASTVQNELNSHMSNTSLHFTTAEKTKLYGVETGAQKNTITGVKGNSESSYRTGNVNITKANIGLGNVDNTSDANKPVSTAQQEAMDSLFAQAKKYADDKDALLLNNSSTAVDSIMELATAMAENEDVVDALEQAIGTKANLSDLTSHTSNKSNPHVVTKSQVGLGNVENKSSATIRSEITKSNVTTALGYIPYTQTEVDSLLDVKVDKVSGKGLSTNDYTTAEKTKLSGIAEGAEVNQNAFGKVTVGSSTITADAEIDTLTMVAGTGISLTADTSTDKVTITNSGVRSVSTGSTNGTISVNTNGTSAEVAVKGLGSAAYTDSSDYASKSHGTHVSYSSTAPVMDGTASVGSASAVARADHKHPTDTSRASKTEFDTHVADTTKHITSTERTNWNAAKTHADSAHAPSNAEKNQNAFSNIKVGTTTIAADTTTDTLTLEGNNVVITPDTTNDKVTISVADGSTSAKGVVQLTNSTSSTSTTTAATPNSVKSAYDLANTANTNVDKLSEEVDAKFEQVKNGNIQTVPYSMKTDCNRAIYDNLEIPLMTSDGKLIGSGIKYSDILTRPRKTAMGVLPFFDNKGNLMVGCLNEVPFITIDKLLLESKTGKENVIRFENGYQICWGTAERNVSFTDDRNGLFFTTTTISPVGFPKSFSEQPYVFIVSKGANKFTITGCSCNVNAILGLGAFYYQLLETETPIKFDWFAIGKWGV